MTKTTKTTPAPYPGSEEERRREMEAWFADIDRRYEEEMARQAAEQKQAKQKEK